MREPSAIAQLQASYSGQKREMEKKGALFVYWMRPLSFWCTLPFLRLGLAPNVITLFSGVAGGIASLLALAGGDFAIRVAAVFFFLSFLLDLVDGNVARVRGISSHFGKFLDGMTDIVHFSFWCLALSIGVIRHLQDYPLAQRLVQNGSDWPIVAIGGLTSLFFILDLHLALRLDLGRKSVEIQDMKNQISKRESIQMESELSSLKTLLRKGRRFFDDVRTPLSVLLCLFNRPDLLLIWYFGTGLLILTMNVARNIRKAHKDLSYNKPY